MNNKRTALVAGASGLVGGYVVNLLLKNDNYETVKIIVRKPLNIKHTKLQEHIIDFDKIKSCGSILKADDVFCAIGTTTKKAGNNEVFRKIDFDYPYELAKATLEQEAKQFLFISSIAADKNSFSYYLRLKGEVENALIGLSYQSIKIFRPSLILGDREELRPKEKIVAPLYKIFSFMLTGPLRKHRAIQASDIAKAMVTKAIEFNYGTEVLESDEIQRAADTSAV